MAQAAAAAQIVNALANHDRVRKATEFPPFYGRPDRDILSARLLIDRINYAAQIPNPNWDDARKCAELYIVET